jgi:putative addiction module component (TIGR02574 family)
MVDIKEILELSVPEKIILVETIWDSIAQNPTSPLKIPESHKEEILRRYEDYKAGNQKTYTWDEVKAYALEP